MSHTLAIATPVPASAAPVPRITKAILLLILGSMGAFAIACIGGFLVYHTTDQLRKNNVWVDHTHTVLEALLQESQYLERIDHSMRLYMVTRQEDTFGRAIRSVTMLDSGALHLLSLVRDNPSQSRHAGELKLAIRGVTAAVEQAQQSHIVPDLTVEQCRQIIAVMQVEERGLLEQRTAASEKSHTRSVISWAVYWSVSVGVMILLFAFIARDVIQRQTYANRAGLMNGELKASLQEFSLTVDDAQLLKNARDELQLCVSADQAYSCAAHHLEQILPGSSGAALISNNSRNVLAITARWNNPPELLDGSLPDSCCALRAGRRRWRTPGKSALHCTHFIGTPPEEYICIPLTALGETFGVIFIALPLAGAAAVTERRIELSYELVELASMAIAGLNLRTKMENQSIRDGLTQLFNRHFMEIALERELHRAMRRESTLALLMLDVDHFKFFNDTFGHEAGDLILRDLAHTLQAAVRTEDIVCRFGGEEFVIILPEITRESAMMRAEAIRSTVAGKQIFFRGDPLRKISISIGIAMFPEPARDAAELLRIADRAMYEAKHGGRNQVRISQDETALLPAMI